MYIIKSHTFTNGVECSLVENRKGGGNYAIVVSQPDNATGRLMIDTGPYSTNYARQDLSFRATMHRLTNEIYA